MSLPWQNDIETLFILFPYVNRFEKFCDYLIKQVPDVCLWAATIHLSVKPKCLETFKLTTPLRSPTVVINEVGASDEIKEGRVEKYTLCQIASPSDGPPIKRIIHCKGQLGHIGDVSHDCPQCGRGIATVLHKDLKINLRGRPQISHFDLRLLLSQTAQKTSKREILQNRFGVTCQVFTPTMDQTLVPDCHMWGKYLMTLSQH